MPSALIMTSTFPRWEGDATPRFVRDLALAATPEWGVTVLAPHHPGAALRERMGRIDVRRFVYFRPSSLARLCYGGAILPNARASTLARAQVPGFLAAEAAALRSALAERPWDLVHAHFLVPQGLVAAMIARKTPLVVSAHGSDVLALRGAIAESVQGAIVSRAAIVTVDGGPMRREIVAKLGPRVEPKLRELPMGVDTSVFHPGEAETNGGARAGRVVLFVGRLSRQKGAQVLLDALPRIATRFPDLRVEIAGDGPELASLRERAGHGVAFLGALSEQERARAYRRADVVVVPSLVGSDGTEAQGLVALEAMASGAPVVATPAGGLVEAVGDDEARGLLARPGDPASLADAIVRCLSAADETKARAAAARDWVAARYSLAAVRERLLAIYDEARWWD
jgi:glycosyltransferase involved in cell wall biosynthesis